MTAKGATSSLSKGRRGFSRVTRTASLAVGAMSHRWSPSACALVADRGTAALPVRTASPMAYKRAASMREQNRS